MPDQTGQRHIRCLVRGPQRSIWRWSVAATPGFCNRGSSRLSARGFIPLMMTLRSVPALAFQSARVEVLWRYGIPVPAH